MKAHNISVIVPAFNVEDYIEECLTSVLAQSYPHFEIIVIDDGSTDKTAKKVRLIARKDPRVRLFHQVNSGVSAARNRGLDESKGQYIAFVDGDDVIRPHFLSQLHTAIQGTDLAIIGVENFNEENGWSPRRKLKGNLTSNHNDALQLLRTFSTGEWEFPNWNKLYRTNLIRDAKIKFLERLALGEDRLFNLQYIMHCNSARSINAMGYGYRMRSDSTYRGATPRQLWMNHCQAMKATQSVLELIPEEKMKALTLLFITSPTIHVAFPQLLEGLKKSNSTHIHSNTDLAQCLELAERSWFDPRGLSLSPTACWLFKRYSRGKDRPAVLLWNRKIA